MSRPGVALWWVRGFTLTGAFRFTKGCLDELINGHGKFGLGVSFGVL